MTLSRLDKFPAPYFGGKTDAAPLIWRALGDPGHYAEPFCGSLSVLFLRPALANRPYYSETVNDADGLLVNAIRSIQLHPQATAEAASWPVTEADLHARHLAIVRWAAERELERLMADPAYCDPQIGGWWLWGMSCWIGGGFASGSGPWVVGDDGRITKRSKTGAGVSRRLPHLTNSGRGVNAHTAREPGVSRQRPHLGDNGRGVNHAGARESGVAGMPELSPLDEWRQAVENDYAETGGYHPMTMPEVRRWFNFLSARLRHVRILNGDWKRLSTSGALKTLVVRSGKSVCGIFMDPPYADTSGRDDGLYRKDSSTVAHAAREWAIANGDDPDYRIVFAGFEGEHGDAFARAGWREVEWFTRGHLKGGMAQQGANGTQQHKERLWLSPHCLSVDEPEPDERQAALFDLGELEIETIGTPPTVPAMIRACSRPTCGGSMRRSGGLRCGPASRGMTCCGQSR